MNKAPEYRLRISDMKPRERPRERLLRAGASSLSNTELLALILRVGNKNLNAVELAQRLLSRFDGLVGLSRAGVAELSEFPGIGDAKVAQIKAAFELGTRLAQDTPESRDQIRAPEHAASILKPLLHYSEQEKLYSMLLDSKNRIIRTAHVYTGNINTSVVRIAEIFREAIRENAAGIIVAHNHPSGDPTPSPDDVRVTQEIAKAGELLDIELLDHLIIGRSGWVSLKERGLGFNS